MGMRYEGGEQKSARDGHGARWGRRDDPSHLWKMGPFILSFFSGGPLKAALTRTKGIEMTGARMRRGGGGVQMGGRGRK